MCFFFKNDDDDDDEYVDEHDGDDDNQCARASRMNPCNASLTVHPNCGQHQQIFMVNSLIRLMKAQACNYLGQILKKMVMIKLNWCRISAINRDSDCIAAIDSHHFGALFNLA